jgi:hypothetical protein
VLLVLPAVVAELLELQTARGRLLVLRRRVVPVFALSALQCHNFPHFSILPDPAISFLLRRKSLLQFSVFSCQFSVAVLTTEN